MKKHVQPICTGVSFLLVGIATGLMLIGCGTTNTVALQNARAFYNQVQANPEVAQNAPVLLHEANQTLQRAEGTGNEEEQRHLAYIAERQTQQAIAEAKEKVAKDEFSRLSDQREKVLLEARTRDAARAQSQAQISQQRELEARQRAEASLREAQQARQEAMDLRKELQGLQSKETERGLVLTLNDIYFTVDAADLQSGAAMNLVRIADFLKKHPDQKVLIEGHTDSTGAASYNMQLSEQRANTVRDMLIAHGVNPNQISARGLGEGFPVASNSSSAGRQQNRRVDLVILPGTA